MGNGRLLFLALSLWAMAGLDAAQGQDKAVPSARSLALDTRSSAGDADPDPLTPAESKGPAPAAPGAPVADSEIRAPAEIDPIVAAVRQRLEATPLPARAGADDRDDRAALAAYYAGSSARPIWTGKDGFTARAREAMAEIRRADDWGLKASAFELPTLPEGQPTADALADAEIRLGVAVLKYARHARGGRLQPTAVSRIFDQKPTIYDPRTLIEAVAAVTAVDAYLRELHPRHPQFERLRQALLAARSAARPDDAKARSDIRRLVVNMERWRWMPVDLGEFHVWDSVPEQMTMVFDKGTQVLAEKIVVGKPSSPTPIFSADMLFVIFHPSWGVPPGIKVHELWPQLKKTGGGWLFSTGPSASSVLKAHDLIVSQNGRPIDPDSVNWSSVDIRSFDFTQPPGPRNLLGVVKFRFPNRHDVYMHDTPERHLFGGGTGQRVFSHGCMRVQNPVRLAEVLLAHDKGWDKDKVAEYVRRGGEVRLTTPIPVHITYFTVWVGDDGRLETHPDVYAMDARTATALEGTAVHLTSTAPVATSSVGTGEAGSRGEPGRSKKQAVKRSAGPQPSFNPFPAQSSN